MAIKVKLVRSWSSRPQDHRETVWGLGLNKVNDEKILNDTPAIRGMIAKVAHLVSCETIAGDAQKRVRSKGKAGAKRANAAAKEA